MVNITQSNQSQYAKCTSSARGHLFEIASGKRVKTTQTEIPLLRATFCPTCVAKMSAVNQAYLKSGGCHCPACLPYWR